MKRTEKIWIITIYFVLSVVLPITSCALTDFDLFPSKILTNCIAWAELFGATDVSEEIETKTVSENNSYIASDSYAVFYNRKTLDLENLLFTYNASGTSADMDLRALALFAAAEYGSPSDFSNTEIKTARRIALPILRKLKDAIKDNAIEIRNGKIVTFYVGKSLVYSLYQVNSEIILIVAE